MLLFFYQEKREKYFLFSLSGDFLSLMRAAQQGVKRFSTLSLPLEILSIDKLPLQVGNEFTFDKVLLEFGQPYLSNVVVKAEVLRNSKGRKIRNFKYRAKKHTHTSTIYKILSGTFPSPSSHPLCPQPAHCPFAACTFPSAACTLPLHFSLHCSLNIAHLQPEHRPSAACTLPLHCSLICTCTTPICSLHIAHSLYCSLFPVTSSFLTGSRIWRGELTPEEQFLKAALKI